VSLIFVHVASLVSLKLAGVWFGRSSEENRTSGSGLHSNAALRREARQFSAWLDALHRCSRVAGGVALIGEQLPQKVIEE
jgi:hypothetical protein